MDKCFGWLPGWAGRACGLFAVLFVFTLASAKFVGCGAAQVACPIIDLADKACETIVMKYVDKDGVERQVPVPREELVRVGERARLAKEGAEVPDGGEK